MSEQQSAKFARNDSEPRECGACGNIIPTGGTFDCALDHTVETQFEEDEMSESHLPTKESAALTLLREFLVADAFFDFHAWIKKVRDLVEDGTVPPPAAACGTFQCPICGADSPHGHADYEIEGWINSQVQRFHAYLATPFKRSTDDPVTSELIRLLSFAMSLVPLDPLVRLTRNQKNFRAKCQSMIDRLSETKGDVGG